MIAITQQSSKSIKICLTIQLFCLQEKSNHVFPKCKKLRFVYHQDDHMSLEYIFHNQYPINCLFKSQAFKKAVDQINKLLHCYGNLVPHTIL